MKSTVARRDAQGVDPGRGGGVEGYVAMMGGANGIAMMDDAVVSTPGLASVVAFGSYETLLIAPSRSAASVPGTGLPIYGSRAA